MSDLWNDIRVYLDDEQVRAIVRAALIMIVGVILSRLVSRRLRLGLLQAQQSMIARKLLSTTLLIVFFAWAISTLGLNIGVVLGAAGVLTVALGFAAQTSVSNLISGAFLMAEGPFAIGDVIRVGDVTGEVLSIDALSIKLRTFDNLMVRVPNETMLKANIINLSHFPIRRYDMQIGVAYDSDIEQVRQALEQVALDNPLCLTDPAPTLIFLAYGDSALQLQFSVWAARETFLDMRTSMHLEVKRAFDRQGIQIPFPQRTIHVLPTGDASSALGQGDIRSP